MKKYAQASLEFLTTYAWAFILILITIAAIAYFGTLNPKKFLPDKCVFTTDIQCKDFKISETELRMLLRNNAGQAIKIQSISLTTDNDVALTCTTSPGIIGGASDWENAKTLDLIFNGCSASFTANGIKAGKKEKVLVKINYYNAKSTPEYVHTAEGEISATVQ